MYTHHIMFIPQWMDILGCIHLQVMSAAAINVKFCVETFNVYAPLCPECKYVHRVFRCPKRPGVEFPGTEVKSGGCEPPYVSTWTLYTTAKYSV